MFRRLPPSLLGCAGALCIAGALAWASRSTDVPRGLRATYFASAVPSGAPAMSVLDRDVSTLQMTRDWRSIAPQQFSATWAGFLAIDRPGTYHFTVTSDDASSLAVNGETVVDLPGTHGPESGSGAVHLEPGLHALAISYAQYGGSYTLALNWARDEGPLEPLPAWRLTPRRVRLEAIVMARRLEIGAYAAAAMALVLLLPALLRWLPRLSSPEPARSAQDDDDVERLAHIGPPLSRQKTWAALAFFALLSVAHTWPLATNPGGLSRNDNGDTILNEWILAWVAHQLPRAPLHLFDANIFYPEPNTLAFSESMVVQSLMAAPVLWMGGSPVLAYNLIVLAGFALSAWAMCLLVARWTGSWSAALVSGSIYGFNAHVLTRIPHPQALHVEFLPAVLYLLDRTLTHPSTKRGAGLALCFVLQALTSIHLFVFSSFALAAATLSRPASWLLGRQRKAVWMALGVAAALSAVLMLPFLLPYLRVSEAHQFRRSLDVIAHYSASYRDYLSTPSRFHYPLWSYRFFDGTALFPGALATLLALWAMVKGTAFSNPRARMCLAMAVVGVVLSFGPKVPGYATLWALLPPLQAIRAVVRFGYLATVGVAVLAGYGTVLLRQQLRAEWRPVATALLVGCAAVESFAAPLGLSPFAGVPAIYRSIAGVPDAVVLEIPFFDVRNASAHAPYMLNSTAHWKPIVNGYSGFQPGSFYRNVDDFRTFPDGAALERMRALDVTHVFVHVDRISIEQHERIAATAALVKVAAEGSIELYRVERR